VANHPSARKRARQNKKRRAANVQIKSAVRTSLKKARRIVETGGKDAAAQIRLAESAMRRAASKGIIPKRRASRQISRLARALKPAK
jgi:small subunit ribosomal protein S20